MKINKLLIATHNPGKYQEIATFFKELNIKTYSLNDLKIIEDYEETGETFEDNAVGKAKFYYELSKMPTLADDSGLCVDALGGMPGVHSRRWGGARGSDKEIVDRLLEALRGVPLEQRTATFAAVMALYDGREMIIEHGESKGHVAIKLACPIKPGIPYGSLFYHEGMTKAASELTTSEKNKVSHRGRTLEKLIKKLKNNYEK